ncbi:MAG: hypothetical protein ABI699_12260 [Caldimonas sp.]
MRIHLTFASVAAAIVVSACGGNDFQAAPPVVPPVTSEVPASASASIDGFIAYLKALVVAAADMLEPVDTSMVTGPVDEVSEPQKVD